MFSSYRVNNKIGVTLVEAALALALGGLVIVSSMKVFNIAMINWRQNNERTIMIQHIREAMDRMMSALRYADVLLQADSALNSNLEFTTKNLDTPDPTVYFRRMNGYDELSMSHDSTNFYMLAGVPGSSPVVQSMTVTPLKLGSGNSVIPLTGGDPLSLAVAVRVDLTMADADGESLTIASMAKLRNKP
jgi:hypothetical protein